MKLNTAFLSSGSAGCKSRQLWDQCRPRPRSGSSIPSHSLQWTGQPDLALNTCPQAACAQRTQRARHPPCPPCFGNRGEVGVVDALVVLKATGRVGELEIKQVAK
ncbi:hypothetical protein ACFX15_029447 [Malus domestica]